MEVQQIALEHIKNSMSALGQIGMNKPDLEKVKMLSFGFPRNPHQMVAPAVQKVEEQKSSLIDDSLDLNQIVEQPIPECLQMEPSLLKRKSSDIHRENEENQKLLMEMLR